MTGIRIGIQADQTDIQWAAALEAQEQEVVQEAIDQIMVINKSIIILVFLLFWQIKQLI